MRFPLVQSEWPEGGKNSNGSLGVIIHRSQRLVREYRVSLDFLPVKTVSL